MPLSPEEIAHKSFSEAQREGFDRAEVETFLAELADLYRLTLNGEGRSEINSEVGSSNLVEAATKLAEERLRGAERLAVSLEEDAVNHLDRTIREIQDHSAEVQMTAQQKAQSIVNEASLEAERSLEQARDRSSQIAEEGKPAQRLTDVERQLLEEVSRLEEAARTLRAEFAEPGGELPNAGQTQLSILFVSRDDRNLAAMAAGLLKQELFKYDRTAFVVGSSGTHTVAGRRPDARLVSYLKALGVDISTHRSRRLGPDDLAKTDLVVAMTQADLEQVAEGAPNTKVVLLKELSQIAITSFPMGESLRDRMSALMPPRVQRHRARDVSELKSTGPGIYRQCMGEIRPEIEALVSMIVGRPLPRILKSDTQASAAEHGLLDWIKYYAAFVGLAVILGVGGVVIYLLLAPRNYQASTLVFETGRQISPRQLALVSEATFQSPAVVEATMERLGIEESPQEFLDERIDLRAIPDTSTLLVIGRSDDVEQAQEVSRAAARSFVTVSNDADELTDLAVFGRSSIAPTQEGIATQVALVLGGTIGFWLGLSAAIFHYRLKRPVLVFSQALSATHADEVTILSGKWSSLGLLSPTRSKNPPKGSPADHDSIVHEVGSEDESSIRANGTRIVVAHPGTGERELVLACGTTQQAVTGTFKQPIHLIWLR